MNSEITKKIIIFSFFFINFIQPSRSAEFSRVNTNEYNRRSRLNWAKISDNKSSKLLFYSTSDKVSKKNDFLKKNKETLLVDLIKKQEELVSNQINNLKLICSLCRRQRIS